MLRVVLCCLWRGDEARREGRIEREGKRRRERRDIEIVLDGKSRFGILSLESTELELTWVERETCVDLS